MSACVTVTRESNRSGPRRRCRIEPPPIGLQRHAARPLISRACTFVRRAERTNSVCPLSFIDRRR